MKITLKTLSDGIGRGLKNVLEEFLRRSTLRNYETPQELEEDSKSLEQKA